MSTFELAYLGLVLAAFLCFSGAMAYATARGPGPDLRD